MKKLIIIYSLFLIFIQTAASSSEPKRLSTEAMPVLKCSSENSLARTPEERRKCLTAIGSGLRPQSKSGSSGHLIVRSPSNPESIFSAYDLQDFGVQIPTALTEGILFTSSEDSQTRPLLSPRRSTGSDLARVASLNSLKDALEKERMAEEREQRKIAYRVGLSELEQRVYDALSLKKLEFIRKQPHLLGILGACTGEREIKSYYDAYMLSEIEYLQDKVKRQERLIATLTSAAPADSPRGKTPDDVLRVIQEAESNDLSPRKPQLQNNSLRTNDPSSGEVLRRIVSTLALARKNVSDLIGESSAVFPVVQTNSSTEPSSSGLNE